MKGSAMPIGTEQGSETKPSTDTDNSSNSKRRALLICTCNMQNLSHYLPGVAKDAENLNRVLGDPERSGFEVTCLLDQGLLAVRRAIAEACTVSSQEDTLLIYYGGASALDDNGTLQMPVVDSDGDYPMATCLDSEFILSQMRQSRCQRFVLIIDGCHSGAFFKNNRGIPDGMVALTSCSADETAMETAEGGAFTQSFLRALTSGKADKNRDGCVTVDDAYDFILNDKQHSGFSTHPQKWVWNLSESIQLIRSSLRVFLSYSSADSQTADLLVAALEQRGITVWRDISGVPGGADWLKSLAQALGESRAVLLLMTENGLKSKWVARELVYADQEKSLPIMPVIIDDVEAPDWLKLQIGRIQRQRLDLQTLDSSVDEIATAIRCLVADKES
jgi:hypothetical protein